MKRFILSLLLVAASMRSVCAQDKILVVGGAAANDVQQSFGLTTAANSEQARATANRVALQAELDASPATDPKLYRYPWYFRGGTAFAHAHSQVYAFDHTIINPYNRGSVSFFGPGSPRSAGTSNLFPARLVLDARQTTYARTVFDGTTNKLTSSGATNVATVTSSRTWDPTRDRYNSIYISGGTNVTAGWYGIASVSGSTLTLDRNWCTGAVTGGTGHYLPAIWRDHSKANRYQGLWFSSRYATSSNPADPDPTGGVGLHLSTLQGSNNVATGGHTIDNCFFDTLRVGVLLGRDLAGWQGASGTYTGSDDNNCDTAIFIGCKFTRCESAILLRNSQSVFHNFYGVDTDHCGTIFDVERGGKINAFGVHIQGPDTEFGFRRLLRLGPGVGSSESSFNIYGFSLDGEVWNPQLLVSDWLSKGPTTCDVTITNGSIKRSNESTLPLVDIQGNLNLKFSGIGIGGAEDEDGMAAGDLLLREGASGTKPYVVLRDSWVKVTSITDLFHDDCDAGITLKVSGVRLGDGTIINEATYTTTE